MSRFNHVPAVATAAPSGTFAPAGTPVRLSGSRFGQVDKRYIATLKENPVSHTLQQRMIKRTPVRNVTTPASGHSAFVEAPDALAAALQALD